MKLKDIVAESQVVFGTSGARGLVSNMTRSTCTAYTQAFLKYLAKSYSFDKVALGIDLRPSSHEIANFCASEICAAGLEVEYCGPLPTPALALFSQERHIPAIMVTGSHIPFDRNGLKFYRPDGEITKADESGMLNVDLNLNLSDITNSIPSLNPAAINTYETRYTNFFPPGVLTGLKLGLYEHSSVARDCLKSILEKLGATVISLGRTEIFVPIDTEAVSEDDIKLGLEWCKEFQFDAILSTDGDGDRPLISDEHGHWLRGDIVGLLTASYLEIKNLAVPVSCNSVIERCERFELVTRTKIGSPFVINGMHALGENGLGKVAGFEANGGFLLGSNIKLCGRELINLPTRDAILPLISLLACAQVKRSSISQLLLELPARYTSSNRLQNFPTKVSHNLIQTWAEQPDKICRFFEDEFGTIVSINQTDGLRITFDTDVIIHIRPSGNAPELRCYCEASSMAVAEAITQKVLLKLESQAVAA